MKKFLTALAVTIAASSVANGFTPQTAEGQAHDPKAAPAYEVLVLGKAAAEAQLADLSARYTDSSQIVQAKRFELSAITREMLKMQRIERADVPKLSGTYGNCILRKVTLEVELHGLLHSYTPQHPDVKKKRVELAALERELKTLLE